jgi:SAM-dependent methyltransferase
MRTHFPMALCTFMLVCAACKPSADAQRTTTSASDTLHFPAPDRAISSIVAPRWTGEDVRDRYGEADKVIALAGVHSGMTVADIGAGDGYYVVRLSPIVGASGTVIGEDIMPKYVDLLRSRVKAARLPNVEAILGTPDNAMLPDHAVDVAFMVHMYHEITRPFELLWNLSRSLKPAAMLVVLDQDGPTDQHGTPPALLRCELGVLGYEQTQKTTLDDGTYVALFRAPAVPTLPAEVRTRLAAGTCRQQRW